MKPNLTLGLRTVLFLREILVLRVSQTFSGLIKIMSPHRKSVSAMEDGGTCAEVLWNIM